MLLAALLLAVGSFGLGGWLGHRLASGDAARKDVAAFSQAHARAVDNAIDDKRLAVERARKNALAERKAEIVYFEGVKDAHLSASAVCDWNPASFRLLIRAIDLANGRAEASAGSLLDSVPGDSETGQSE